MNEYGITLSGKIKILGEKPATVPLGTPQIPHGLVGKLRTKCSGFSEL